MLQSIKYFRSHAIGLEASRDQIFPNFQNCAGCVKYLKDQIQQPPFDFENMLGYLSLDIICSSKFTVLFTLRSRETVHFSEQIMSVDKYLSIFPRQIYGGYCLFIPQNFLNIPIFSNCVGNFGIFVGRPNFLNNFQDHSV